MYTQVKTKKQNSGAVGGKHSLHTRPTLYSCYDYSFIESKGVVTTPTLQMTRGTRVISTLRLGLIQQDDGPSTQLGGLPLVPTIPNLCGVVHHHHGL